MRIAHLGMLQTTIGRMSAASASLKSTALAVVTATSGAAAALFSPPIVAYSAPLLLFFALVDARYLAAERGFRRSYDHVRLHEPIDDVDFAITTGSSSHYIGAFFSWSVLPFYLSLAAFMAMLAFLIPDATGTDLPGLPSS